MAETFEDWLQRATTVNPDFAKVPEGAQRLEFARLQRMTLDPQPSGDVGPWTSSGILDTINPLKIVPRIGGQLDVWAGNKTPEEAYRNVEPYSRAIGTTLGIAGGGLAGGAAGLTGLPMIGAEALGAAAATPDDPFGAGFGAATGGMVSRVLPYVPFLNRVLGGGGTRTLGNTVTQGTSEGSSVGATTGASRGAAREATTQYPARTYTTTELPPGQVNTYEGQFPRPADRFIVDEFGNPVSSNLTPPAVNTRTPTTPGIRTQEMPASTTVRRIPSSETLREGASETTRQSSTQSTGQSVSTSSPIHGRDLTDTERQMLERLAAYPALQAAILSTIQRAHDLGNRAVGWYSGDH